jgi:hypothetical protein
MKHYLAKHIWFYVLLPDLSLTASLDPNVNFTASAVIFCIRVNFDAHTVVLFG